MVGRSLEEFVCWTGVDLACETGCLARAQFELSTAWKTWQVRGLGRRSRNGGVGFFELYR